MFFFYNYTIIISDPKRTPCLVQIVICLEIIMKKILILFLACLVCASNAGAWGLLADMVVLNNNRYIYKKSFLYHVLTQKNTSLRVCVSTDYIKNDPKIKQASREWFLQSTQEAFDDLLAYIRTQLGEQAPVQVAAIGKKKKKSKTQPASAAEFARKNEFADIVAALPRRIELQMVNPNGEDCDKDMKGKYDLHIKTYKDRSDSYAPQTNRAGEAIVIKGANGESGWAISLAGDSRYAEMLLAWKNGAGGRNKYPEMEKIVRHEVSHLFGLADQYNGPDNMHEYRSLIRTEGKGAVIGRLDSVMNKSGTFTCDDLEGFINAIDFIWGMEGKTSPRLQNGWESLCGKPYFYLQGIPVKKSGDSIDANDLAEVKKYLNGWNQKAGEVNRVQQLEATWKEYLKKVEEERDKYCDSLYDERKEKNNHLDNAGLVLSAKCNYLTQKANKIRKIIEEEVSPAVSTNRQSGASAAKLQELEKKIEQKYGTENTPKVPALDAKGLLTAKPLEYDFTTVSYACLVCGKPVINGAPNAVQQKGWSKPVTYYTHPQCDAQAKKHYHKLHRGYSPQKITRKAPTVADLTPTQEKNQLVAKAEQHVASKPTVSNTPAKRSKPVASNHTAPVISGTRPTGTFNKANPKPIMPVTNPQPVISRKSTPKERLDFFIATHHGLKDSLEAVRRGTALPEQQRELQAYNALFEEFKKSRTSAAHKGTPIAAKPSAPKAQPVAPKAAPKAAPVAPKPSAPKAAPVAPRPSAPKAAPKAKPTASKATCVVCHQEMDEGTFYTDSVGRTVHKHSSCAYHFFKRFHKTDDASLDRYSGFYFFNTPNDVVGAKADMKKLDLTVSDIRRYRGAQEASAEAYRLSLGADKAAKARTKAKAEKCRVFQPVTPADVAFFEKQNQAALVRITQKQKAKRRLSKKETSLKRQYQQLKKNMELTKECKN